MVVGAIKLCYYCLLPDYKLKVDVEVTTINHLTTFYQLAINVLQLNISVVR